MLLRIKISRRFLEIVGNKKPFDNLPLCKHCTSIWKLCAICDGPKIYVTCLYESLFNEPTDNDVKIFIYFKRVLKFKPYLQPLLCLLCKLLTMSYSNCMIYVICSWDLWFIFKFHALDKISFLVEDNFLGFAMFLSFAVNQKAFQSGWLDLPTFRINFRFCKFSFFAIFRSCPTRVAFLQYFLNVTNN